MKSEQRFDVIIVGAGIVGLTAAILAAEQQLSVAVLEKNKPTFTWDPSKFDHRVSAITRHSQNIFQQIKVWEEIQAQGLCPYQKMIVWDGAGFGEMQFDAQVLQQPNLGHIIENRVMLKSLWQLAEKTVNIQFFLSANPISISQNAEAITLTFEQNQELNKLNKLNKPNQKLTAPLLIGSDGAHSWVRNRLNMSVQTRDYEQSALVATVTTELPHNHTAWQRFLPQGPLAFLPLSSETTCSIVWSNNPSLNIERSTLNESQFCELLSQAFDYRLGKVLSVENRACFPLKSLYANPPVAERVALIGDAARVIHPMAGLGINLGLADAKTLIDILSEGHRKKFDLGHATVLNRYARARKSQSLSTIRFIDFLYECFGSENSAVKVLRSLGLNAIDKNSWIKKKIVQTALGISDVEAYAFMGLA